jgi:protein-tyrosine kinase
MRLRSTDPEGKQTILRADSPSAALIQSNDAEPPLLPEQAGAVKALQQQTGRSFEECAVELGYLPEAAYDQLRLPPSDLGGSSGPGDVDPLIVMISNPDDPVVNAARELRSIIATMNKADGSPLRRIAMLSLRARTETSVLTGNLAVAFALSGQRTLLIDANFGAPVQHGLFRRNPSFGVAELLRSHAEPIKLIQATSVPNLDIMPNGKPDGITVDLTHGNALALATEQASERYDAVIVDAGEADQIGISCAQGFDGSIILVQRGLTALRDARKLVDRLRSGGDAPVGMVMID